MPLCGVAVAVENDGAVLLDDLREERLNRRVEGLALAHGCLQLGRHVVERLGDCGVQRGDRTADRHPATDGAELEAVAREREGARAVAVARVHRELRQGVDADLQGALALRALRAARLDLLEDVVELLAEEDRDDCGRRLVRAEAVIVRRRSDHSAQHAAVLVHGADDGRTEHEKLRVLVRRGAWVEKVTLRCVAEREVHVLAAAVHAGERLLVEEADHAVPLGDTAHRHHDELLMIRRDVALLEHRGELELTWRDLVVPRLCGDTELEELVLRLDHERKDPLGNRPEVVVLELLTLRRLRTEERTARGHEIGTRQVELSIDEEVLLLRARVRNDLRRVLVPEELQNALCLRVQRLGRTEQRRLLVERLASPRHERRRDAESRAVEHVGRARDVPRGVAARLERRADATAREARCVWLPLDECLTRELRDGRTVTVRREEGVVLLGRRAGQRIKDVRVVRRTLRHGPVLHGRRYDIRDGRIESLAVLDRALERSEDLLRQGELHRRVAEDIGPEDVLEPRLFSIGLGLEQVACDGRDCLLPNSGSVHDLYFLYFPIALTAPVGALPVPGTVFRMYGRSVSDMFPTRRVRNRRHLSEFSRSEELNRGRRGHPVTRAAVCPLGR